MKYLVALVASLLASQAHAIGCDTKEYAQYKDHLRTRDSRHDLALDYCLYDQLEAIRPGTPYAENCSREKAKIMDALRSVRATAEIKYALNACEDRPKR